MDECINNGRHRWLQFHIAFPIIFQKNQFQHMHCFRVGDNLVAPGVPSGLSLGYPVARSPDRSPQDTFGTNLLILDLIGL